MTNRVVAAALASLVSFAVGAACTQTTDTKVQTAADTALEAAKDGVDAAGAVGRDIGVAAKEATVATGEVISDTWLTTKVSAQFVDETLLEGSRINVDVKDHVVTLRGTVSSAAARTRAVVIATETDGVTRVVDQLDVP